MGDKIKIFPAEVNGVNEPNEDCELALTADLIELNPAVDGYDDVDAWIRNNPGSTDHHAGYYHVIGGEVITIVDRKQMRVSGPLTLDGILVIDGTLVLD